MIFRQLSQEEYNRLSPEERMDYLQRLMADIQEKLEEQRKRADAVRSGLRPPKVDP